MTRDEATKGRSRALAWSFRIPGWVCVLLVTVAVASLIYWFWVDIRDWMQGGEEGKTNGETLRNLMLILAPFAALPLAYWRSMTAQQQANATQQQANAAQQQAAVAQQQAGVAQQQAEVTQKQAEVAQKGLQNDRYQRGSEMLGSEALSTRISGIYALEHLARDHPEDYHIQIMDLLCAFIRNPQIRTNDTENATQSSVNTNSLAPDVQEALSVIGRRSQNQRKLEEKEKWRINLSQARLTGAYLMNAHLERTYLESTHLERSDLRNAHFEGADLRGTHLESATLWRANFEDAFMLNTHLELADLEKAHMVRANLDGAYLEDAKLRSANLEGANLEFAHLKGARLKRACLQGTNLTGVELNGADLEDADLTNACMKFALLEGAKLGDTKGLTQSMLDSAKPSNPPHLKTKEGHKALCADFKVPLMWRRNPPAP